jgi:hypothetical protein
MQHTVRINKVERRVWKIEALSIADEKAARQAGQSEPSAGQIDRRFRQIYPGVISAGLSELGAIGPDATTNFQNLQAPGRGKIGGCGDVPLFFITVTFDPLEKFAGSRLSVAEFTAARMILPKSAHPSL